MIHILSHPVEFASLGLLYFLSTILLLRGARWQLSHTYSIFSAATVSLLSLSILRSSSFITFISALILDQLSSELTLSVSKVANHADYLYTLCTIYNKTMQVLSLLFDPENLGRKQNINVQNNVGICGNHKEQTQPIPY